MSNKRQALFFLGLTLLVLTGAPRAHIRVTAPIYLVDGMALLTLLLALREAGYAVVPATRKFFYLAIVMLGAIAIGQANAWLGYGALKESVYMFGRYFLALSFVWVTPKLINSADDLMYLMKFVLIGAVITSLITIGVSLPITRPFFTGYILSIEFLEPAASSTLEHMEYYSADDKGNRGRSLVGAPTLTGGFLNVIWPLTFLCIQPKLAGYRANTFAFFACLAIAAGAVLTYSRGAILGLLFGGIAILMYGERSARRNVVVAGLVLLTVVVSFGWDSDLFYFDRVARRTGALLEGDLSDDNDQGRLKSLIEPVNFLMAYPSSIFVGSGNTRGKGGVGPSFFFHNTPAAAFMYFGLIGALAHSGLFLLGLISSYFGTRSLNQSSFTIACYRTLTIVFIATIPWWAIGHAAASFPRAAMLFFFTIGLVCAIEKLAYMERVNAEWEEEEGAIEADYLMEPELVS